MRQWRRALGLAALLVAGCRVDGGGHISAAAVAQTTTVGTRAAKVPRAKPRLPPGTDPGGAAIGLITAGIDYTNPEIVRCLARDGEGELIGWDMVDGDRLPWAVVSGAGASGAGTLTTVPDTPQLVDLFKALPCGRVRIVPVRVDPADGYSLARAMAFFSVSPARVVVLPEALDPVNWQPMSRALDRSATLLLIVATGARSTELQRTSRPNLASVSAKGGSGLRADAELDLASIAATSAATSTLAALALAVKAVCGPLRSSPALGDGAAIKQSLGMPGLRVAVTGTLAQWAGCP